MKIEFNSDDNLELNKPLKFHLITKIIRSVFEDGKPYPQVFLDDALYKLRMKKMLESDRIDFWGGIKIKQGIKEGIKQAHQKNLIFVTAGILKILVLSMSHIFAIVVMIWWKELRVLMMLLLFTEVLTEFTFGIWAKMQQLA